MDFEEERIQTGGNADTMIAIGGDEAPADTDIKLWFPNDVVNTKASEVVNSMDGNETDMSPSVHSVKEYINGTVLYNDETGSNGNVTLTDNVENYKKLKIYGYRSLGNYNVPFYHEILYPYDDLRVGLTCSVYNSEVVLVTTGIFTVILSGNQITKMNQTTYNIGNDSILSITNSNGTSMYITRVVGYKEV